MARTTKQVPTVSADGPGGLFDPNAPTKQETRAADRGTILRHLETGAASGIFDTADTGPRKVTLPDGTVIERR